MSKVPFSSTEDQLEARGKLPRGGFHAQPQPQLSARLLLLGADRPKYWRVQRGRYHRLPPDRRNVRRSRWVAAVPRAVLSRVHFCAVLGCEHAVLGAGAATAKGSKRVNPTDENETHRTGEQLIVDEASGMVDEHLLEALRKLNPPHRLIISQLR